MLGHMQSDPVYISTWVIKKMCMGASVVEVGG